MVAVNRLTGHSPGFFSVYTLPPNQAASVTAQRRSTPTGIRAPGYRNVTRLILRKSRSLLADATPRNRCARQRPQPVSTADRSGGHDARAFLVAQLTSWSLRRRSWMSSITPATTGCAAGSAGRRRREADDARESRGLGDGHDWHVFPELTGCSPGGHVAFEVGEVRGGTVRLEESVVPGAAFGPDSNPVLIMINSQSFTNTSHCWRVSNHTKGTNTNRVTVFQKRSDEVFDSADHGNGAFFRAKVQEDTNVPRRASPPPTPDRRGGGR